MKAIKLETALNVISELKNQKFSPKIAYALIKNERALKAEKEIIDEMFDAEKRIDGFASYVEEEKQFIEQFKSDNADIITALNNDDNLTELDAKFKSELYAWQSANHKSLIENYTKLLNERNEYLSNVEIDMTNIIRINLDQLNDCELSLDQVDGIYDMLEI